MAIIFKNLRLITGRKDGEDCLAVVTTVVVENLQRKGYFWMVFGFGLIPKFMEMMRLRDVEYIYLHTW